MFFLAGAAASGAMDLISSLRQTLMPSTSGGANAGTQASLFNPVATQTGGTSGATAGTSSGTSALTPATMNALLALQGQQDSGDGLSSQLFSLLDANGDGSVSRSEFEKAFAGNGDTSKADALFAKLDTNNDGSVSQSELSSALKGSSSGGHHHHHGMGAMGSMASTGSDGTSNGSGSGTTTKTVTNSDGSTTTTISYSDGTSISMTQQPSNVGAATNPLERMFQRQAQMFAASTAGQSLSVTA